MTPGPDDPRQAALARSSRRAGVVSVLGLALLLGSIAYSYVQLADLRGQIDGRKAELAALEASLARADAALKERQQALDKITPPALQALGYKDPHAAVPARALAESADAKRLAESLTVPGERGRRGAITLQYYARKLDDEVNMRTVLTALAEAGFTLERKAAQLPGVPTNAIFFGPEVQPADVKLVALTLIGAGIKIRTMEPLLSHVSRPRLIQIGADLKSRDATPLTVEQIRRATSFAR